MTAPHYADDLKDTITRLRAENERLQARLDAGDQLRLDYIKELESERDRLLENVDRIRKLPDEWEASTQDGRGARREHWRGPDFADGEDAGLGRAADELRRAFNDKEAPI